MRACLKRSLLFVLTALLLLSCTATGFAKEIRVPELTSGKNWMREVPNDAYLNALNIPGTHDSGMSSVSFGVGMFAQTQSLTIKEQMEAGARIFDLRLRYGGNNENYLCHGQGMFNCDAYKPDGSHYTYEDALTEMAEFLEAHPTEAVLYFVRDEDPDSDEEDEYDYYEALGAAELKIEERWAESEKHRYIALQRKAVPEYTMGEVRGDIICFPESMGFGDLMNEALYNNYEFNYVDKWDKLKPYFDSAPDQTLRVSKTEIGGSFRAAYASCTGQKSYDENGNPVMNNFGVSSKKILPTGGQEAEKLNPMLLKYPFENGAYYGWIAMDYLTADLAELFYGANNYYGEREHIVPETTYIKDIAAFCDDDYDDAVEACYEKGYTPLKGTKANGASFLNVNPKGDPIVIGYTLTTNPDGAITDIVGRYGYDSDTPEGYEKVLVYGSAFNYFTRWAGGDSEYTYLFVSRDQSHAPITELVLLDHEEEGMTMASLDLEDDRAVGSEEAFNLQAGLGHFVGLAMVREDVAGYGTIFSEGNIVTMAVCFAMLLGVLAIALWMKRTQTASPAKSDR